MIVLQILTILLFLYFAFADCKKTKELLLFLIVSLIFLTQRNVTHFYRYLYLSMTVIVTFVLYGLRHTFSGLDRAVYFDVNKRQKYMTVLIIIFITSLLSIFNWNTQIITGVKSSLVMPVSFGIVKTEDILKLITVVLFSISILMAKIKRER